MKLTRRKMLGLGLGLLVTGAAAAWFVKSRLGLRGFPRFRLTKTEARPSSSDGAQLYFFATGDTGQSTDVRDEVIASMRRVQGQVPHAFITSLGDNIYPDGVVSKDDPAWQTHFVEAFGSLGLPVYPCLGNHDHSGNTQAQIDYSALNSLWRFPSAYHSFTLPLDEDHSAEFFMIDTQPLRIGLSNVLFQAEQLMWLSEALAASSASWKIVCGHHPIHSGGPKGGSSKISLQLEPLLIEHGVDLYLSGHNHTLEVIDPGQGYVQVVSGAAAAPDKVELSPETRLSLTGGGFCSIALGSNTAWINFVGAGEDDGPGLRLDRIQRKD